MGTAICFWPNATGRSVQSGAEIFVKLLKGNEKKYFYEL